jgi:hypothetical protein
MIRIVQKSSLKFKDNNVDKLEIIASYYSAYSGSAIPRMVPWTLSKKFKFKFKLQ